MKVLTNIISFTSYEITYYHWDHKQCIEREGDVTTNIVNNTGQKEQLYGTNYSCITGFISSVLAKPRGCLNTLISHEENYISDAYCISRNFS